jgi:hypothetical protein
MHTKLRVLLVTGLLIVSPASLLAQTEASPVLLDSRVRVTMRSAPGLAAVGTLDAWDRRSLELAGSDSVPRTIPLSDVVRLEVSRGKKGHALTGLAIGATAGVAAGVVTMAFAFSNGDEGDMFYEDRWAIAAVITAVTTVAGAGLGALVGALIKTEKWEDVPLPATIREGSRESR